MSRKVGKKEEKRAEKIDSISSVNMFKIMSQAIFRRNKEANIKQTPNPQKIKVAQINPQFQLILKKKNKETKKFKSWQKKYYGT